MRMSDLVDLHGTYKKVSGNKGGEYHGPCPVCGGTDRFHVWPEQKESGTWWCRGCDKGGDVIQFLIDMEDMSYPEACKQVGRELPPQREGKTPQVKRPAGDNWQPSAPDAPAELWRQHAEKFVSSAHQSLLDLGEGEGSPLQYLAGRGIRKETAIKFRLGWNPGEKGKDSYRTREAWGLETILKDGKKKKLWLPIGLVIPYFIEDKLIRIRIRIPNERRTPDFSTPYYVIPGSGMNTFICNSKAQAYFITEAELDAILIDQEAGDLASAMGLGNNSAKPTADAHAILDGCLHIGNALDYDPSFDGDIYENPGGKQGIWWTRHYSQCERWPVPAGKDPGDAYKAGCNIREWVKLGLPPIFTVPSTGEVSKPEKENAPLAFDHKKMQQTINGVYSQVMSAAPKEAMQWLHENMPHVIEHLNRASSAVDKAFSEEDETSLLLALATWEKWHLEAWKRYESRPPIIERQDELFNTPAPTMER